MPKAKTSKDKRIAAIAMRMNQLQKELSNNTWRRQYFGKGSLGTSDETLKKNAEEMKALGDELKKLRGDSQ